MAETAQENTAENKIPTTGEEAPSMEDILRSIRGVIAGEDEEENEEENEEDVLELTEIVDDEPLILADEPALQTFSSSDENKENMEEQAVESEGNIAEKSVLDDIDNILGAAEAQENPSAPEPFASLEESSAPLSTDTIANVESVAEVEKEVMDYAPAPIKTPEAEVETLAAEEKAPEIKPVTEEKTVMPEKNNEIDAEHLITEKVAQESAASLKSFMNNMPRPRIDSPVSRSGATLEDLVIEAMRPFLADWLNENLPTIVKQIVTKEIKKLIPKEDEV